MARATSTLISASFGAIVTNCSRTRHPNQGGSPCRRAGDRGKLVDNRPRAHVCSRCLITADDADILLNAIDQTLASGSSTFAAPLADIRSKIAYLTGRTTADEAPIRRSPPSMRYGSAFAERCALRFLYQNGRGEQERAYRLRLRHVRARGRCVLLRPRQCHRRHQDIPLRPYRSRLASFEGLRHPCRLQSQRLLFFEFDFADRPPVAATLSFARRRRSI